MNILLSGRCFALLQQLVAQVSRGLRSFDSTEIVSLSPLENLLARACLHDDPRNIFKTLPAGYQDEPREAHLLKSYFEAIHAEGRQQGVEHDIRPLPLQLDSAAATKCFKSVFGDGPKSEPEPAEPGPGELVRFAFSMARYNRRVATSRIATLDFLARLRNLRDFPEVEKCVQTARTYMYGRCRTYSADMLKFAVVLNDEASLALVREELCRSSFGQGFSVIEYLQVDGRIPGRWDGGQEQAFRDELARRLSQQDGGGGLSSDPVQALTS